MEYKVITSKSAEGLNNQANEMIGTGWEPVGGHHVVTTFMQNRFSGLQIHSASYTLEYSQTFIKK